MFCIIMWMGRRTDGRTGKVFNDPIHGNIELHPLCVRIVDTPQFQRLRFIKQLGGAYFVYPGAAHNRFEHSIGVCHLAGRLVRALREQKSKALKGAEITPVDILCVEVAGLCHDLGHGPFSHLFDRKIIPKLREDKKWEHENGSVDMFRYMLEENGGLLKKEFEKEGITSTDLTFIEELIAGPDETSPNKWKYKGRPKEKGFLYEIASNKRNGIDVDKWDYFARDCYMLGIGINFSHNRCIAFPRVINVQGERQICFRNKEAANLYDMFHTRYLLHNRAYQHKTNNIIEHMIYEALVLANDFIKFPGQNGKQLTMSEAIDDMKAYSLLNDGVIYKILESTDPGLEKSKQILLRVLRRDLYKFVGEERFAHKTFKDESDVREDMKVTKNGNIVVQLVNLNYGKKDMNPIDFVNFYSKEEPDKAGPRHKEDVSLLLPKDFAEQLVRVYCKDPKFYAGVEERFDNWSKKTTRRPKKRKRSDDSS
ncbi:deoxynucleoside triphosphate triphosphohydrolase SAMHD1-like [Mercenaria mercenaria]|uniref:deoxynucleoside triphosphate triphosphohydrolase SAMHD1-like n=1 Tax=Mercenaria mercenaria TaxID=6596 RepID=UPI00234EC488|nr:deoxynucleoside triphosphate triphosphohydrolase SAMHD1-like [Mercenaria mercenaria]